MTWRSGLARVDFASRQRKYEAMAGNDLAEYQADMDRILSQLERTNAVKRYRRSQSRANAVRVVQMAATMLNAPHAEVNLITDQTQTTLASVDTDGNRPVEDGWCRNVVALGDVLAVEDPSGHALVRASTAAKEIGAYLGVPLTVGKEVVGSLCVFDDKPRRWTELDALKLQMLAEGLDVS